MAERANVRPFNSRSSGAVDASMDEGKFQSGPLRQMRRADGALPYSAQLHGDVPAFEGVDRPGVREEYEEECEQEYEDDLDEDDEEGVCFGGSRL